MMTKQEDDAFVGRFGFTHGGDKMAIDWTFEIVGTEVTGVGDKLYFQLRTITGGFEPKIEDSSIVFIECGHFRFHHAAHGVSLFASLEEMQAGIKEWEADRAA